MTASLDLRPQLRQRLRRLRQELSHEQQKAAATSLARHLPDNALLASAQNIALYIAQDGELDPYVLAEVLHTRGKQLALPVIHPFHTQQLLFVQYQLGQPLIENRYGIPEPKLEKENVIPIAELDVILMPLVGFDVSGNRLGMGGGFYDRTLGCLDMAVRPRLIGLAHRCQQIETLPTAHWDVPIDGVACEGCLTLFNRADH